MIGRWNKKNSDSFVRDLIRDFCSVYAIVTEQSKRFERSQTISYAVLRDLLGEATRKGVFWRLKDTAHHLFRYKMESRQVCISSGKACSYHFQENFSEEMCTKPHLTGQKCSEILVESMLDWCIGYAFHECSKLKEDAFQRQHYTNRLLQIKNRAEFHMEIVEALMPYTGQTTESIARELERILGVLKHVCQLLLVYLHGKGHNEPLALFLAKEEEFAKSALCEHFDALIEALYGNDKGVFYLRAVKASLDGGHLQDALHIAEKSQNLPDDEPGISKTHQEDIQKYILDYKAKQENFVTQEN